MHQTRNFTPLNDFVLICALLMRKGRKAVSATLSKLAKIDQYGREQDIPGHIQGLPQ